MTVSGGRAAGNVDLAAERLVVGVGVAAGGRRTSGGWCHARLLGL